MKALVFALGLLALAACNPTLTAQSPSPPGRTARLDPVTGFWGVKSYRLEISQGVAIAITCDRGDPCEHMQISSDAPAIAEVRLASLGVLQQGLSGSQTSAALVVIGKAAGATTVRVRARQGSRLIAVRVVAPPPPLSSMTAAR